MKSNCICAAMFSMFHLSTDQLVLETERDFFPLGFHRVSHYSGNFYFSNTQLLVSPGLFVSCKIDLAEISTSHLIL